MLVVYAIGNFFVWVPAKRRGCPVVGSERMKILFGGFCLRAVAALVLLSLGPAALFNGICWQVLAAETVTLPADTHMSVRPLQCQ